MTDMAGAKATLVEVSRFFGITIAQFRKEWSLLTPNDKTAIQNGIGDGSYNYIVNPRI